MVSQEDAAPEDQAAMSRRETGEDRATAFPAGARTLAEGFQQCPYLAGRPPCGTHHLFPSGTNVCWADPGEEKPYRAISRDTQSAHCFGGSDGPRGCDRYRQAVANVRPLPHFESWPASASPRLNQGVRRRRPPRRPETAAPSLHQAAWLVPLALTGLLLLLLLR
jgi:hypothetical protein